jgi:hypothetical protein
MSTNLQVNKISSNSKSTIVDYTPILLNGTGAIDLSLGNNFRVDTANAITLSFSNMSGREGQSGNIYLTGGSYGISTDSMIVKSGEITASHWISYFVIDANTVVISVSGEVA